jgi:hypothetical protein
MYTGAVVAEGFLVHALPISGDRTPVVGGLLLAGVLNLLAVAGVGPVLGTLIRRRRGDLPVVIARDYAGRALIVVVAGALALLGLGNQGRVDAQRRALGEQASAVRLYIETQAPVVYRERIDLADTAVVDANLFRTCVPGDAQAPWLCVFVDTTQDPPGVTVDPSREPNSTFVGRPGADPGGG